MQHRYDYDNYQAPQTELSAWTKHGASRYAEGGAPSAGDRRRIRGESELLFQKEFGFTCRSWVIWY